MDNTLNGAMPSGNESSPEAEASNSAPAFHRVVKGKWTILGSTTALLVGLGAALQQGAGLSQAIANLVHKISPKESGWTADHEVVIEPDAGMSRLTLQMCDSGQEGATFHIALLTLEDNSDSEAKVFALEKEDCPRKESHVLMNPDDFKAITKLLKAGSKIKLAYIPTHVSYLHALVTNALEIRNSETSTNH